MATSSGRRIFVDTNILTRATISTAPLHDEAVSALLKLRDEHAEMWISHQVIREYVANATRPQTYGRPIPMSLTLEQVARFRAEFKVAEDSQEVLRQLILLLQETPVGGKQVHDANIVATMLAYQINTLLTANMKDMRRFKKRVALISLVTP